MLAQRSNKLFSWSNVTAVFGGTFDPPHLGHLTAIQGLLKSPGVKRVLVCPSASPAYKPLCTPYRVRLEMIKTLLSQNSNSKLPKLNDDIIIDESEDEILSLHPHQPVFAIDLILKLSTQMDDLAFVIGSDQLISLPTWHKFPEVLGCAHWIVLQRQEVSNSQLDLQIQKLIQGQLLTPARTSQHIQAIGELYRFETKSNLSNPMPRQVLLCHTEAKAASSTQIRQAIEINNDFYTKDVPEAVLKIYKHYLKQRALCDTNPEQ